MEIGEGEDERQVPKLAIFLGGGGLGVGPRPGNPIWPRRKLDYLRSVNSSPPLCTACSERACVCTWIYTEVPTPCFARLIWKSLSGRRWSRRCMEGRRRGGGMAGGGGGDEHVIVNV